MAWCSENLIHGYCPIFFVECSFEECNKCRTGEESSMSVLANRAEATGVERERSIRGCESFGTVLQGLQLGCCGKGGEIPRLVVCKKIGKPVSAYACYSCPNFKVNDNG
jgi:hypothetical protein